MAGGDQARVHIVVSGRVQGVGFRYFVSDLAGGAGLHGWVRNRPEGSVECLAEGPRDELERLVRGLRDGPPWAEVADLDVSWAEAEGDLVGFRVVG